MQKIHIFGKRVCFLPLPKDVFQQADIMPNRMKIFGVWKH